MRSRSRGVLPAMLVVALTSARPAHADEAAARAHFKRGIELYDRKQLAEALAAFQDAYREKPSAGIKQNVGLCLKGLGKPAEAATAFDEALDEGKGTLKPETRAAIERELAELTRTVATVNLTYVLEDRRPAPGNVVLTVEAVNERPRDITGAALARPLRLMPGLYLFRAHLPGYPDPPDKKLALVSGAPIDVAFVFGAQGAQAQALPIPPGQQGTLAIRSNVPTAKIRLDGREVGQGTYVQTVPAGPHRVEVLAPGHRTFAAEVVISAGAAVEYPVQLQPIGDAPEEYRPALAKPPPRPKHFYGAPMLGLAAASYRLGVVAGEPSPYGTRRDFGGAILGGRGGWFFWKYLAAEAHLEIGTMNAEYKLAPGDSTNSKTTMTHWQLAGALRLVLPRESRVHFTAAAGFGVHGLDAEAKLNGATPTTRSGNGVGYVALGDAGAQFDVGPIFLEAALFFAVHNVEMLRAEEPPETRFFYASPSTRGGLRAAVGFPF